MRFRHCSWEMQQPADGMGRHAGRRVQHKRAGVTAVGHAPARPALEAAQTLRKGSGGKSRAWLAASRLGGKFTRESWVAYRRAMHDHRARARYEHIGRLMRLHGRSNCARRKRHGPDSEGPKGRTRSCGASVRAARGLGRPGRSVAAGGRRQTGVGAGLGRRCSKTHGAHETATGGRL